MPSHGVDFAVGDVEVDGLVLDVADGGRRHVQRPGEDPGGHLDEVLPDFLDPAQPMAVVRDDIPPGLQIGDPHSITPGRSLARRPLWPGPPASPPPDGWR